jgi:hypothetical protein
VNGTYLLLDEMGVHSSDVSRANKKQVEQLMAMARLHVQASSSSWHGRVQHVEATITLKNGQNFIMTQLASSFGISGKVRTRIRYDTAEKKPLLLCRPPLPPSAANECMRAGGCHIPFRLS